MATSTIWLIVGIVFGLLASAVAVVALVAFTPVPIVVGLVLLLILDAVIIVAGYRAVSRSTASLRKDP